ncbi:MAG TPA: FAD:protein FMN transferase [Spirochaetia bacterium]|nr:FAD:protein FMN transferase [Spirochaetia bacterium]
MSPATRNSAIADAPLFQPTELIMGMPITVAIPAAECTNPDENADLVFALFRSVDLQFSPYKTESEVSRIDRGELVPGDVSPQMQEVLRLSEDTKRLTNGFFDVWFNGRFDPSGLVKGWSILKAARLLDAQGIENYCIDAGGDIEIRGYEAPETPWKIGLRNPFDPVTIIRTLALTNRGIATSGTYIRGEHIYNPRNGEKANSIASITVVAPNVYEADRLATAAFAMGEAGVEFIASIPTCDAYMVDKSGTATYTPGFARYIAS